MAYDFGFARVYDKFSDPADAVGREAYVLGLLQEFGAAKGIVLDLACGTGHMSETLLRAGYEVIGTDSSEDMLNLARERLQPYGEKALLLGQDMRTLDLFGTVNACVCCMDSVNHLLSEEDVRAAFRRVALFTEPGGVFVFDVNTVYKHERILGDHTFVFEDETDFLVWQNEYDAADHTVSMYIDVFSRGENNVYKRYSDEITERAYELSFLRRALREAGFSNVHLFADRKRTEPGVAEERVYFVAVK